MGRVTTAFVVLLYLAVFLSVFISDQLPSIPEEATRRRNGEGGRLSFAYTDLQHIARRPHPYLSHENDRVREYILGRVLQIQKEAEVEVEVSDDLFSTGKWGTNPLQGTAMGVYFEGTNIIVRIRGTMGDSDTNGAVLFSAHYDSVSTSSGAVDDGIGVVTLLQLLDFLSKHDPPRRTVVFNFNNGEEDGLNGARAFLLHPWITNASSPASEIPAAFLNLEGASSGGRPLLFRATGGSVLGAFAKAHVPHPHANVLTADAFSRGLVRSGTDYSVYNQPCAVPFRSDSPESPGCRPIEGMDLAFYRGRSKYHTKYDALPYVDGGKRALWAMMETTWAAGRSLAHGDSDVTSGAGNEKSVYFDLFGVSFLMFPLSYLLTFNITALVAGPIILILVLFYETALMRSRRLIVQVQTPSVVPGQSSSSPEIVQREEAGTSTQPPQSRVSRWQKRLPPAYTVLEHLQFWIALIVAAGIQVAIAAVYLTLNPFIVYTYPFLVLLTNFSFAIVVFTVVPSFFSLHPSWTAASQTRALLLHTYIFTYILLILSTVGITRLGLGGFYFISIWNALVWLGCMGCAVGGCIFGGKDASLSISSGPSPRNADNANDMDATEAGAEPDHDDDDSDERTPLIGRRSQSQQSSQSIIESTFSAILTYIPSLLLAIILIPVPLIPFSHVTALLLGALPQTLADGSPAITVYVVSALLGLLGGVLVLPFVGLKEGEVVESPGPSLGPSIGLNGVGKRKSSRSGSGVESSFGTGFGFGAIIVTIIGLFGIGFLLAAWVPWPAEWLPASRYTQGWEGGLFPFNEGSPLKVFFQQKVLISRDSDDHSDSGNRLEGTTKIKVSTTLVGASPFVEKMILPALPSYESANDSGKECVLLSGPEVKARGLWKCSWVVWEGAQDSSDGGSDGHGDREMIPYPGGLRFIADSEMNQQTVSEDVGVSDSVTLPRAPWDGGWQIPSNKWITARAMKTSFINDLNSRNQNQSKSNQTLRTHPGAQFRIRGRNTRGCRVYFNSPVKAFRVPSRDVEDSEEWTTVNTTEIRLWSRTWGREFALDIMWGDEDGSEGNDDPKTIEDGLGTQATFGDEAMKVDFQYSAPKNRTGRVACEWAEYESGMVGMGGDFQGTLAAKIPAYEEVLTFLPRWAVANKLDDGLVEVESQFVL
ncbi:hypothetical protein D9758_010766 [Tetrapyrgos nigripes]|uniref:Peptide hydrolase n=1 Tax=Tetrapyrgos nigripes TaxID=182062 RepID=A0A8H5FZE5_9AGAR|nr:hypothetical protein D9758_010766 [Tetrapyrgos nigripes]